MEDFDPHEYDNPVPSVKPVPTKWVNILTCNHEVETDSIVVEAKCTVCGTSKLVIRRVRFTKPIPDVKPVPAAESSPAVSDASQWTPGPWRADWDDNGQWYIEPLGITGTLLRGDSRQCLESCNAHLIAAAPDLYAACTFVKSFLTKLEDGSEPGDPLRAIRRKFHAPLHAVLDAAIQKARGEHA